MPVQDSNLCWCRYLGTGEMGKGCRGRREKEMQGSPEILKGGKKKEDSGVRKRTRGRGDSQLGS